MDNRGRSARVRLKLLVGAALALLLAGLTACGDDADPAGEASNANTPAAEQCTPPAEPIPVKLAISPQILAWLPYFIGIDKGYFEDQGLDLEVETYAGPSGTQTPRLARGDIDLAPQAISPSLLNSIGEGFRIKLLIANNEAHEGYLSNTTVVAASELLGSEIESPADVKGLRIDAQFPGTIADLLIQRLLNGGGLTEKDVQLTYRAKTPPDMVALFENEGADVGAVVEPFATLMQSQGFAEKWLTTNDLVPGFQDNYLAASEDFLEENRCAAVLFVKGYLRAAQDVMAAKGEWTPELVETAAKWTDLDPEVIRAIDGAPYVPPGGEIDRESLQIALDLFTEKDLIKSEVDFDALLDPSIARGAQGGS